MALYGSFLTKSEQVLKCILAAPRLNKRIRGEENLTFKTSFSAVKNDRFFCFGWNIFFLGKRGPFIHQKVRVLFKISRGITQGKFATFLNSLFLFPVE